MDGRMTDDERAILKRALEEFAEDDTADQENLEQSLADLEFVTGLRQWDEADASAREEAGRPMLTINRMPQFVRQVTGDIRRTNPSIRIKPGDNAATGGNHRGACAQPGAGLRCVEHLRASG